MRRVVKIEIMEKIIPLEHETHTLDLHLGNKLRERRLMLGFTQEKLAFLVGLTFQQVQKYERGLNRISASRLYELAEALRVPVTFFYEGVQQLLAPQQGLASGKQETPGDSETEAVLNDVENINFNSRETGELLRAYYRIEDPKRRRRVLDLIRAMNDAD